MSDEEQIQKALDTLALMREVATLANSQIEADEAERIITETETWIKAAVKMAGKSISGEKMQAAIEYLAKQSPIEITLKSPNITDTIRL